MFIAWPHGLGAMGAGAAPSIPAVAMFGRDETRREGVASKMFPGFWKGPWSRCCRWKCWFWPMFAGADDGCIVECDR